MDTRSEARVLALWEAGARRPTFTRALILAAQGAALTDVATLSVGRRDALLIALRRECFGSRMECVVDCPDCAAELELELSVDDVTATEAGADRGSVSVDGVDLEFRAATAGDLIAVSGRVDARQQLIERCLTAREPSLGALTASMYDAVSDGMSRLDPQAAACVQIDCAVCGYHWAAPFDIGDYLWSELRASASRTMREVYELATGYGWSESEVLAVSPIRRQHYLNYLEPTAP